MSTLWFHPIDWQTPTLLDAARWFASGDNWLRVLYVLWLDIHRHWPAHLLVTAVAVGLLVGYAVSVGRDATKDSFVRRARRLLFHALTPALVLGGLLCWYGWRLTAVDDAVDFTAFAATVGAGLCALGIAGGSLLLAEGLFAPQGWAATVIGWPDRTTRPVRRGVRFALADAPLPVFVMGAALALRNPEWKNLLGPVALAATLACLAASLWLMLPRDRAALKELLSLRDDSPMLQRATVLRALVVGFPLALLVAALIGFHELAYLVMWRFVLTLWLMLGLTLTKSYLLVRSNTPSSPSLRQLEKRLEAIKLVGLAAIWAGAAWRIAHDLWALLRS
jgi:hypothetical protein